jgi:translocation and assembly module TamA
MRARPARHALLVLLMLVCAPLCGAAPVRVEIVGLDATLEHNARAHLSLDSDAARADLPESNVRALHARAPEELRDALVPFGYYSPKIESSLSEENGTWVARYTVDPGEPVLVSSVDTQISGDGADEPSLRSVLKTATVREGSTLRHDAYEQLKGALLAAALEHGYRDAQFTESRIEVDPEARAARIVLHLATGPRYRFGELTFEQSILRPEFLQRYVHFAPGDPYDAKKLLDLQYALYDSEYFSAVELIPGEVDGDRVPITIKADPRTRRNTYRVGGGYETNTGPRIILGWANRRLNSLGHRAVIDTMVSEPEKDIEAQYVIPLADPARDSRIYAIHTGQDDRGDTTSTIAELIARDTRQLGAWQRQVYARLANERTDIGDSAFTTTAIIPGMLWTRTRADDPILPKRGSFVMGDFHGSGPPFGADITYVHIRLDGRLVRPLGEQGRLVTRMTLGATSVDSVDQLPASERFFAGGDQSIRGFDLDSLGPINADGLVVGGRYLLTGSFEYQHRVRGPWGAAVFLDGGYAFDEWGDSLEYGAGVGVRYRTPLGMVRLDIAWPLSGNGSDWRLHFAFGPEL